MLLLLFFSRIFAKNKNMETTIEVYTLCFRVRRSRDKISFSDEPDIYEMMKSDFINYIHNSHTGDVPAECRTVRIPTASEGQAFHGYSDSNRYIYGVIESGLYGKQLEIADKDNPENILFTSTRTQAVLKPFFFLIKIPRRGDTALLVLERTDNESIYPLMRIILSTYFRDKFDEPEGMMVDRQNYISSQYLDELRNGRMKSVSFTLKTLPSDLADQYMVDELDENTSITLTLKFRGGLRPEHHIAQAIRNNHTIFTSEDLQGMFDTSQKSIVAEANTGVATKERTYYLSGENNSALRPFYTLNVQVNSKGYSSFSSIKSEVFNFINVNSEINNILG